MKLAVISDVHGDVHALRDALRLIDEMGVSAIVCLGDVVDYGVFPDETLELLAERRIRTLRGNHDRWSLSGDNTGTNSRDLTRAARKFLATAVPSWCETFEGVRVAAHHARPGSDMLGITPDATADELNAVLAVADADVLIVGHTHVPMALHIGERTVLNPGALLRDPADGWERELPTPGSFGVLDLPEKQWTVIRARTGQPLHIAKGKR